MGGMTDRARLICRAIDLGIYDDNRDARAYEGRNLSDAEWADVRGWWDGGRVPAGDEVPF